MKADTFFAIPLWALGILVAIAVFVLVIVCPIWIAFQFGVAQGVLAILGYALGVWALAATVHFDMKYRLGR